MEETWIAKRGQLRQLLIDKPNWTNQMYADALGMSVSWVKDWKRVFRVADPNDDSIPLGRTRHRRTAFDSYDLEVIEAVLNIRDHPPAYCPRTPGPAVIQYELQQRFGETGRRYPRSTSTIWGILDANQRILRTPKVEREPIHRPDPMTHWEIDFSDVTTVPPDPDGKQQHAVEMLNIMDRGTSILVESLAADNYTAETSILAMVGVFLVNGLPKELTIDRDPRFVGGYQGDDFPSAFLRFLLCLNLNITICPPRRPDLKSVVERVHRTIKEECIRVEQPNTLSAVQDALEAFSFRYNADRPHQGRACGNKPPYQAFPTLPQLPRLPRMINPDSWLKSFHGRQFRRRVRANGSVSVDRRSYYVGKAYVGTNVLLHVDADQRVFRVYQQRQEIREPIPIKGLYDEELEFETYLKLICEEARTEWRQTKRLVRERRLAWAA
jgi:hypothetical protein